MSLGQLRELVTLRAPSLDEARTGAGRVTFRDVARVRAAVRNFRESELARFRQQAQRCEREFVIRRRADLDTGWRLVLAGVEYEVEGVTLDDRRQWQTIKAFKVGQ